MTLEITIEDAVVADVERLGGRCIKLSPKVLKGIPDRLALIPRRPKGSVPAQVWFVETKKPKGGRYNKMQKFWRSWLVDAGFNYIAIHTHEKRREWITMVSECYR